MRPARRTCPPLADRTCAPYALVLPPGPEGRRMVAGGGQPPVNGASEFQPRRGAGVAGEESSSVALPGLPASGVPFPRARAPGYCPSARRASAQHDLTLPRQRGPGQTRRLHRTHPRPGPEPIISRARRFQAGPFGSSNAKGQRRHSRPLHRLVGSVLTIVLGRIRK